MHPADHLQPPSIEQFDRLQTAAGGHIRMMTIAPELEAGAYAESQLHHESVRDSSHNLFILKLVAIF
jgi:N-acetylglucosamine-6-phosphate deacetylase